MVCWPLPVIHETSERQAGFVPPNLSPRGLELIPHELADGVYALMANRVPKDNNGLVVGRDAALVIDAGITPGVGRYLQDVVGKHTDKPIRYLVNTTYHGDHSFGNASFGDDVTIVSSRLNKAAMTTMGLEEEKQLRLSSLYGDPHLDEVVSWRAPDLVFDRFCEIDLGGRVVHLWHFGPGNGSGDTIVHVPDAGVAWVGNFLRHAGIPPMLLAGDPVGYGRSIRSLKATLRADTLVPGHGPLTAAADGISWHLSYLDRLATEVSRRSEAGETVEKMLAEYTLDDPLQLSEVVPSAGPDEAGRFDALVRSNHELNVLLAYRWLTSAAAWAA
ncbi:Glyoxylase, beta-lactamase superfamily II [Jiangella alba]|uniref:Glyoxylase, beta-lactamase superfamily II n=1 Tax=Jiangella alba TaxID=561176 RepID=A0A1H5L282_9ACTN|nr:Glyoxylase, beta-lactamase superfamily II [Jiangella alba]